MQGGCHCGAVRYEVKGEPIGTCLCHCSDCRRHAGAPMVSWAMFSEDSVTITKGKSKLYQSSEHGRREFCENCGSGLFYKNPTMLPNIIDVQSATLDEPDKLPAKCHIQTAERISWLPEINNLPEFERFPPMQN